MIKVTTKINGAEQINKRLKQLPEKLGNKAMKRALRKGANVIKNLARKKARKFDDPDTPDPIWQNIIVASGSKKRERQEGGLIMRIGVRGGAKSGSSLMHKRNEANKKKSRAGRVYSLYHWRFLEFGTSQMRAQPFMVPAMIEGAGKAMDATLLAMKVETDKELTKLGAR